AAGAAGHARRAPQRASAQAGGDVAAEAGAGRRHGARDGTLTPPGPIGSFWPTERQTLILRAALCDGEPSVAAWSRLRPELDLDTLEPESTVLLPLVGRQLAAAGLEEPLLPRLQGMRRRTWTVNQLRLDRPGPALGVVQ